MSANNNSFINLTVGNEITIITHPDRYRHALNLLRKHFSSFQLNVINIKNDFEEELLSSGGFTIWLGDIIHYLPKEVTIDINNTPLAEGAFILRTVIYNQQPMLLIAGGAIAGTIYAVNEFSGNHLTIHEYVAIIPHLNISQTPALPYRFFWTWDHSTNWYLDQCGMQEIGFANPYTKPEDGFLEDYYRLIDFMSLNRINGLTIYGFLRDSHKGIDAAQALCHYASERGVRIFPGVGINSYGSIYWEGEHPYNLTRWLRNNPSLRAQFQQPKKFQLPEFAALHLPETFYLDAACPSKIQNNDYHVAAIQWLAETFDIGGINFETGDYGVCQCVDCIARHAGDQQWSIKDMALVYPQLFSAATRARNNLWLICEAYWDNLLDREAIAPLADLPDNAIYQFCINRSYAESVSEQLTPSYVKSMPRSKNIWRTHMGSQWQHERYTLVAERYAKLMQLSYQTGLQGGTIFGEVSAFNTVNEINYLAFASFGYNATMTWEHFIHQELSPLLGGKEAANRYLTLLKNNDVDDLKQGIAEARDIAISLSGDSYRRWVWLQNHLYQKLAMRNTA